MKIKSLQFVSRNSGAAALWRWLVAAFIIAAPIAASNVNAQQRTADAPDYSNLKPNVSSAVKFDLSPPLRSIKPNLKQKYEKGEDDRGEPGPINNTLHDTDPVVQSETGNGVFGGLDIIPPTGANFDGMLQSSGPTPPDTNGDIGRTHYVQMVNSRFQIFNRNGTSAFGPANINTLFSGFGGGCETQNSGDPVVLYDQFADRWLLSQFTASAPYFNCVAVSTTSDPTGTYYRYAFSTGSNFPDYPKYGLWDNAYFISTREFAGGSTYTAVGAYALNRAQILAGNPNPTVVSVVVPRGSTPYNVGDGLLPADLDGNTPPPPGSPHYFVGTMDSGATYGAPQDALTLWKFQLDWVTPANSSFTLTDTIPIANFDTIFPCVSGRNCIPQPSTTVGLDILSYRQRPLFRLAYRNFGTYESLVTTQSVEATTGIAGMRWWDIRSPNASPVIFQEGTYAPGATDGIHRWMGSVAQDTDGNMAIGYSVSNASIFPGIRYTGRLATDPLGTLPQGEGTIVNGGGSQTSTGSRWGDYSSLNIDPTDDCTFWYTTEYYATTSSSGWRTRVGSFKFPSCAAAPVQNATISGRVTYSSGFGIAGLRLVLTGGSLTAPRYAQTNAFGFYQFTDLPVGENYTISFTKTKYTFTPPSQTINLTGNFQNANFVTN